EIIDLIKMYGSTPAVRGVSFSIKRGEFFGFLGPNGAGKTTTINCITGIATPSEGTVRVFGIDAVTNYRETRRLVGLSPQEFNVDIFATTREILHYIAGFYGIRKRDREPKIEELLKGFVTMHLLCLYLIRHGQKCL
ncbi:MAG: ABC transporter ATP-binding protein, partial [Candidatus Daviesbacteria bacterium GW2011_GWB1_36_5]